MAGNLSYVLGETLAGTTETILSNLGGRESVVGRGAALMPNAFDVKGVRRITVVCQNKSTTQSVTFNVEVAPGQKDPDTDELNFLDVTFTGYTVAVPATQQDIVDIQTYHPFLRVKAQAAGSGSHIVRAYIDGYQDARG